MFAEIDTYWTKVGGADPAAVVAGFGSRARLLHLKDGPADGPDAPMTALGAGSMDLPAIFCPAGFMASGRHRGELVGAGTHTRKFWDEYRAGRIDEAEWIRLETVICVVTIRQPETWATDAPVAADAGLRLAQILADRTGGRVVHADWTRDLGPAFTTLLDAYRQRYILSFTPEGVPRDGRWHPISVKLRQRAGRVHARDGYWSP